eukprot:2987857-Heterocapsa_arctica.AAC.1
MAIGHVALTAGNAANLPLIASGRLQSRLRQSTRPRARATATLAAVGREVGPTPKELGHRAPRSHRRASSQGFALSSQGFAVNSL